jgi:LysR family transcriptional activator of nhaA
MIWLNYQHLYYYWMAVRKGSIAAACESLRLAPSTVSTQIHSLENQLGQKLMRRAGKRLVATDAGELVFRHAEQIFAIGEDLLTAMREDNPWKPRRFQVGIVEALPKLLAHWLIRPALRLRERARVICREGRAAELLAQLAVGELDLVLSDSPASPAVRVRAYSRMLGESGVAFLASGKLARVYRRRFPQSLDGAPLLIPTDNTSLRAKRDQWLETKAVRPNIIGEFEDHAMLRAFADSGEGIVPIPSLVKQQFLRGGRLREVGRTNEIRIQFYGITTERKLKYAPVIAICERPQRTG